MHWCLQGSCTSPDWRQDMQVTNTDLVIATSSPLRYWSVLLEVTLMVSWVALRLIYPMMRAASSLKRKNPSNKSNAIEMSRCIGSVLECSYLVQHAASACLEIGVFLTIGLVFWCLAPSTIFLIKLLLKGWEPQRYHEPISIHSKRFRSQMLKLA